MSTATSPRDRIGAIDGMRAIAILMVIFDHLTSAWHQGLGMAQPDWMKVGGRGVAIFFFLSGYLITSRLKAEYDRTGRIDLKRFYLRRFFRLMPAAWLFLASLWFLSPVVTWGEIRAAVFFYRNYYESGTALSGHFWSLSVEEQFYLVWPAVLVLAGFRRARVIAIYGGLGVVVWRLTHSADYYHTAHGMFRTEYRADMLMAGCWLGIHGMPSLGRIGETLAGMLSGAPLQWIGRLSYSLYLWQQPFTCSVRSWQTAVAGMAALCLFAALSYYLIERPTIAAGRALTGERPRPAAPAPGHPGDQIEFRDRYQIPRGLNRGNV